MGLQPHEKATENTLEIYTEECVMFQCPFKTFQEKGEATPFWVEEL